MRTKIVEALAEILKEVKENNSIEEVSKALRDSNKFDEQTLSAAFNLVYEKLFNKQLLEGRVIDRTKNFRILSDEELDVIGIDNYNYLLKLQNIGVLEELDFEKIIEQLANLPQGRISEDDINFIVLFSLVDLHNDIQPGSRIILISSDTIN